MTSRNNKLKNERLVICRQCPYRVMMYDKIEVCDLCGCVLDAKARVKDEICYDGR